MCAEKIASSVTSDQNTWEGFHLFFFTKAHIIEENQYHMTFPTCLCITLASFNVKTQRHDYYDHLELMMVIMTMMTIVMI